LGDMEKESALEWVDAYKSLLANGGNSSFKIPVLYEHQNDIKFVPFGNVPNDIMFDRITLRYAALITAAYGMTLSDIGIQVVASGGETLAGSIRSERKTRKTGFARLKKKIKYFFEQILPPTLQFAWVDYDDEVNVALGRARLSNATASKILIEMGSFSKQEIRQQLMADGMFTISMPEEIPPEAKEQQAPKALAPRTNDILGKPVPVSMGGQGEIRKYNITKPDESKIRTVVAQILTSTYDDFVSAKGYAGLDALPIVRYNVTKSILDGEMDDALHGVNSEWVSVSGDVSNEIAPICDLLLKKSVVLLLKDILLADEEVDFGDVVIYDSILDIVTKQIGNEYENIIAAGIQTYQGENNG
jgi:hypothetical protein